MKDDVDVEYLRSRISYDPDTGAITWNFCSSLPKNWNTKYAGRSAGFLEKATGYLNVNILDVVYRVHRVVWAIHYGTWPAMDIDHEDRNRSNNRILNLREATASMNHGNMKIDRSNNTSGYKGVSWEKLNKKWSARIKVHKKSVRLGMYLCKHEAARAYNAAAIEGFGAFAKLNIIHDFQEKQ